MGVYDLAACVNYITNLRKKRINVIGYSLGGTITLILLAERAEFNRKIQKAILMAPAVRMKNSKSPLDSVRFWAPFIMVGYTYTIRNTSVKLHLIAKLPFDFTNILAGILRRVRFLPIHVESRLDVKIDT